MTWSCSQNGTLKHEPTGLKIGTESGIELDGHRFSLTSKDIEISQAELLGSRCSSTSVCLAIHKPAGQKVAVPALKVDSKEQRKDLLNEIKALSSASGCPNLVQLYGGYKWSNSVVHVVLEFMDRGSLADLRMQM